MRILVAMLLTSFVWVSWAKAEEAEQVVVTASRLEDAGEREMQSRSVIRAAEIQAKQEKSVAEVLRSVPGVTISEFGGPGQLTSVSIRGSRPGQVLVTVDGVEMNGPQSALVGGGFDFANFSTLNIEKIEVLRGNQTVVYGPRATAGVILITTKKGSGPMQLSARAEYGTYSTWNGEGLASGGGKVSYSLGAAYQKSDGFPIADADLGNRINSDSKLATVSGRFGLPVFAGLDSDTSVRFANSSSRQARSGGPPTQFAGDDPNFFGKGRDFYLSEKIKFGKSLFWEPSLAVSYMSTSLKLDNDADDTSAVSYHILYSSYRWKEEFQNHFFLDEANSLKFGLDSEQESGSTDIAASGLFHYASLVTNGIYAQHELKPESSSQDYFFSTEGVRLDGHNRFGVHGHAKVEPGYRFVSSQTTLKGSLAAGYQTPSLNQIDSVTFGQFANPNLKPERNISADIGVEQSFFEGAWKTEVTYFHNWYKDLIDLGNKTYINVNSASAWGLEWTHWFRVSSRGNLGFAYTYTNVIDNSSGWLIPRHPLNQFSADFNYAWSERWRTGFSVNYIGGNRDYDAVQAALSNTRVIVNMPSHEVTRLTAEYRITKSWRVFGRIENFFDTRYEEVNGYGTSRRAFYIGASAEL